MEINAIAKEVHENAKAHGWWDGDERSFGELIALCHSELSEALEEYGNGKEFTEGYYSCKASPNIARTCNGQCKKCPSAKLEGIPSELADCVIRIMDMCEHYDIDLEAAILEKREHNKSRPYRHGGKVI